MASCSPRNRFGTALAHVPLHEALAAIGLQQTQEFAGLKGRGLTAGEIAMLIGYAILMFGVCMLACVVPTLRALRVQPTEALRAE
jgi:hypothetical protein